MMRFSPIAAVAIAALGFPIAASAQNPTAQNATAQNPTDQQLGTPR